MTFGAGPTTKKSRLWDEVFHSMWETMWKKKPALWIKFQKSLAGKEKMSFSALVEKQWENMEAGVDNSAAPVEKTAEKSVGRPSDRS